MTLFTSNPQYREKATIWKVFSWLPLFSGLAAGRIYRWFAINIPMDLGTGAGSPFTSDIDIIGRFREFPSRRWIYETWEVKVALLCKDGGARSLKAGKTGRLMTQLRAYRNFGSPAVSLLDAYVCEAGCLQKWGFPQASAHGALRNKISDFKGTPFGHHLLPFEIADDGHGGHRLIAPATGNPLAPIIRVKRPETSQPAQPFSRLAARLDEFFERSGKNPRRQITFCRACRELQSIQAKQQHTCPNCDADLIAQS